MAYAQWFMTYSPFAYLRRCAKAQRSLVHHIKTMLKTRREELNHEREVLPAGEKVKAPTDILGALVASQMEVEDEARMGKGEGKIVGLTDKEVFGNTCKRHVPHAAISYELTDSHLHHVRRRNEVWR